MATEDLEQIKYEGTDAQEAGRIKRIEYFGRRLSALYRRHADEGLLDIADRLCGEIERAEV